MPPSKRLLLFFGCTLLFLHTLSQQRQSPAQYAFTHYKMSDGLASNIVNNVVQDRTGYIWISTFNGLQRFDGNKFKTFKSDAAQPGSLPSDEIAQVYLDRNNNLWVLTYDNKVGIFNTTTFRYREVPIRQWNRETVHIQKTFLETPDGALLLHFRKSNELYQYDAVANVFVPSNQISLPENWTANYVIQDQVTKKFLIATDSGFVVFNPAARKASYRNANAEHEPLIDQYGNEQWLNYMFLDGNRRLFFEQWPKSEVHPLLRLFNLKTNEKQEYNLQKDYGLGYHQIKAMLEQQNGTLWMYGLPFLAEYTGGADPLLFLKKDYNKERDLKFNQVYAMYEDRQHNIWVCTDYGIYLFNPDAQLFQNYTLNTPKRYTVEGRAQAALQLPNGEIWIGYRDLGLYRYNQQLQPLEVPASIGSLANLKSVWDIHLHQKTGTIWMGLQGGKLIVYDTATKQARLIDAEPFDKRAITQIVEDKEGNIWFGTQGGNIVKWDCLAGTSNLAQGFTFVAKANVIEKMFVDTKGFIWITSFSEGILKIDPHTDRIVAQITKNKPKGFNLWSNDPKDFLQYNDSLLLVASGALNLVNLKTNAVQQISTYDGLPSNTVMSLAKDKDGVLWLGTLNGLWRADLDKKSFTIYDQSDGLLNEDFNVAGAHCLNDGRLLFTAAESFVVFDPSIIRKLENSGVARITNFKLFNIPLSVDSLLALKRVNLSYNKNSVAFEFSALNYNQQNKLEYYYQLHGFDTAWIRSDERHEAVYSFLPPGDYEFYVKTKNIEGVFSPNVAQLNISVAPPFWKTWWFYMTLLLLLALVLYLIDRERMRRLKTLHSVRSDIASHLHLDVSTTLNNINVLSQIAKLKADRDIIRSKELIDEISDKSYNMVVTMDEILWSIDPSNDTMEKTLLRIFEYAETLETNYSSAIDIVVHEKVRDLRLDMKVRHDFLILCKEALQSLVQGGAGKNIMVDIDLIRSRILLKILSLRTDGDDQAQLLDLKERLAQRAAAMHAALNFETDKRETSIVLSIPLT